MPSAVFHSRPVHNKARAVRVAWLAAGVLSACAVAGGAWRIMNPAQALHVAHAAQVSRTDAAPAAAEPVPGAADTGASQTPSGATGENAKKLETAPPAPAIVRAPEHKPVEIVQQPGPARPIGERINLNAATAEQLALLPGIGPKLAQAIIADRSKNGAFKKLTDLDRVKGIGKKKIDAIRSSVTVE